MLVDDYFSHGASRVTIFNLCGHVNPVKPVGWVECPDLLGCAHIDNVDTLRNGSTYKEATKPIINKVAPPNGFNDVIATAQVKNFEPSLGI